MGSSQSSDLGVKGLKRAKQRLFSFSGHDISGKHRKTELRDESQFITELESTCSCGNVPPQPFEHNFGHFLHCCSVMDLQNSNSDNRSTMEIQEKLKYQFKEKYPAKVSLLQGGSGISRTKYSSENRISITSTFWQHGLLSLAKH